MAWMWVRSYIVKKINRFLIFYSTYIRFLFYSLRPGYFRIKVPAFDSDLTRLKGIYWWIRYRVVLPTSISAHKKCKKPHQVSPSSSIFAISDGVLLQAKYTTTMPRPGQRSGTNQRDQMLKFLLRSVFYCFFFVSLVISSSITSYIINC